MFGLPLGFTSPLILGALIVLPILWYLLKLTPPKPQYEFFPPLEILRKLTQDKQTPAKSPWWLTLLRLAIATLLILAMAGPIWRPQEPISNSKNDVILIVDDGWASGNIWDDITSRANLILSNAATNNSLVTLIRSTDPHAKNYKNLLPEHVKTILAKSKNISVKPNLKNTAHTLRTHLAENPNRQVIYLNDGLSHKDADLVSKIISETKNVQPIIYLPTKNNLIAINKISNNSEKMIGTIIRAQNTNAVELQAIGYDKKGLPITQAQVSIPKNVLKTQFEFIEPIELRNQIVKVELKEQNHAGAVQLLDDSNKRRIVGLISSHGSDISQPLLSPLYYINRALAPFSDTRQSQTANIDEAISNLYQQNISAIIFADIGNLQEETTQTLQNWIEKGGMLIRFAGPRLAANPDAALLPIKLVEGDRLIGGALSWEEPKQIAPFESDSPFYGLEVTKEITINRQVMASQIFDISKNTWARLEDGTPMVTAEKKGKGWVILFHVNSDNNWSNLPLSGTFVEMLRRLINLSHSKTSNIDSVNSDTQIRLPAFKILDGQGKLRNASPQIKPLLINGNKTPIASLENPPGQYGVSHGYVAINLLNESDKITAITQSNFKNAFVKTYSKLSSINLTSWLIAIATTLFILDCFAVLWFAGAIKKGLYSTTTKNSKALLIISLVAITLLIQLSPPAYAQDANKKGNDEIAIDFSATLQARLAYVVSGIKELDEISEAGLSGLSQFIASRTALVPGKPYGVNIQTDELTFYPILYWPLHADSTIPSAKTMARIDAYMKQGGSVLFDTRDQISGILKNGNTAENLKLRQILSGLDIPTLEPVPNNHALTKSFYLLDKFPGRYNGGELWVERIGSAKEYEERKAKTADGVSSILITSNDLAGAWALDKNGRAMFATIPANPAQRHYAFRTGVNILMYMMTGNYKSDQVHIPALLERLGQ